MATTNVNIPTRVNFTAQCHASAAYAVVVCLSVYLSVCHKFGNSYHKAFKFRLGLLSNVCEHRNAVKCKLGRVQASQTARYGWISSTSSHWKKIAYLILNGVSRAPTLLLMLGLSKQRYVTAFKYNVTSVQQ